MKLRALIGCSTLLMLAVAAPAADPQLLRLVMPDARIVSGVDVARVKTSALGNFFLSQLPASDSGFQQFVGMTGFDPRRDIHEVLLASADPRQKSGLMLVRGTFDGPRIIALFKSNGGTPINYNGVDIISHSGKKQGFSEAVAFLDSSIAVAGDLDSVKAAIDRRKTSATLNPVLAAKVANLSGSQDAWGVSLIPPSELAGKFPEKHVDSALQGDLVKAIEQTSGGIRFGQAIEFTAEAVARTDQDATSLADVLKFFVNLAQLQGGKDAAALSAMLQNLIVKAEANTVKVSFSIAESDLETLIKFSTHRAAIRP